MLKNFFTKSISQNFYKNQNNFDEKNSNKNIFPMKPEKHD